MAQVQQDSGPEPGEGVARPGLAEWLLTLAAWLLIGLATLAIRLLPFRRLSPLLGHQQGALSLAPAVTERQRCHAITLKRAVRRAAEGAPFRSDCLPQAFAAAVLCRVLGIPLAVHLGVRKDEKTALAAHAWSMAGPVAVSGGPPTGEYEVVGCFLRPHPITPDAQP